ncbi:MAG TPA: DUF1015 domain-containing protein, partial [Gemmatimonadales bacterium]|nr:DUF1015 domain-containing protein [Gemmatimonadales bacterium]
MRLRPFKALRPAPELASQVAAVPYDVVDRAEAAELARGNPHSFLHVGRSDIDLPEDIDQYDPRIYAKAREALDQFVARGTLLRDPDRSLYLYRQVMDGRTQTGVVGCVHVDDYESNVIRKHEKTRQDKEDDRTRHVLTLNAHAEPVFLAYRGEAEIERLARQVCGTPALYDFAAPDGVRHTVWKVADPGTILRAFQAVPHAYVADGHHRSASAWRAGKERRKANPKHDGSEEYNWFLTVLFPANQLTILPYNRVVRDLAGKTENDVLEALRQIGKISRSDDAQPTRSGTFGVYLPGGWHRLELPEETIDRKDPIASLDVSLLQERVLGPVLGIGDPRTDKRIDFVGGIRGTAELENRVNSGRAAI